MVSVGHDTMQMGGLAIFLFKLKLLNKPGEGTFYRPNMSIPFVLDLSFATSGIVTKVKD